MLLHTGTTGMICWGELHVKSDTSWCCVALNPYLKEKREEKAFDNTTGKCLTGPEVPKPEKRERRTKGDTTGSLYVPPDKNHTIILFSPKLIPMSPYCVIYPQEVSRYPGSLVGVEVIYVGTVVVTEFVSVLEYL